jgi:hypothetical protein
MGAGTFETGGGGGAASGAASAAGATVSMGAGGGGGASDAPFDVGAPAAGSKRASAAPGEYSSMSSRCVILATSLALNLMSQCSKSFQGTSDR